MADAVPSCARCWRRSPDTHAETRLELLVELAFIGNADLATHAEATRMIAAEAARRDRRARRGSDWCWLRRT